MCKHPYSARWHRGDGSNGDILNMGLDNYEHNIRHCPNFSVPDPTLHVKYAEFRRTHQSLLHFWNDFYNEYLNVTFPRLLVRFEDLVFRPREVTKAVCECAGGSMRPDGHFAYVVDSAKKGEHAHGKVRTGYVDAIIKYGTNDRRYSIYEKASDLEYIRDHVDRNLMDLLKYPLPDPSRAKDQQPEQPIQAQ